MTQSAPSTTSTSTASAQTPPFDFDTLTLPVRTPRLILRRPTLEDADRIALIANDIRITSTTASLPYPYTAADARKFLGEIVTQAWSSGKAFILAIDEAPAGVSTGANNNQGVLVGTIGLTLDWSNLRAELGFWIGVDSWGKGYATEASRAMIRLGFDEFGLERIFATRHAGNDASGRVQEKAGMRFEGVMRSHLRKEGKQLDSVLHAITRADYLSALNDAAAASR